MNKILLSLVSTYVGCSIQEVRHLAKISHKTYKIYKIPKKKSGERTIYHPSRQTKALQYALMETVFAKLDVHKASYAYKKIASPLLKNATIHAGYKYSLRIDMDSFFPSIAPFDLINVINAKRLWGQELHNEDIEIIELVAFAPVYKSGSLGLAIGAPCSPMISNAVMYNLDEQFSRYSESRGCVYTRYADDLVFSSNKKGECKEILDYVQNIISQTESPRLKINTKKTSFMSRKNKRMICGLYVCPDSKISVGRDRKRYLRKLLNDYKYEKIKEDEKKYLKGYLAYVLDVEPDLYNRLAIKYGADLLKSALLK